MNLLHIVNEMDPKSGGVCQAVRSIISGLEDLNTYNEVVSLDMFDATFLKDEPFPIHALGRGKGAWSYSKKLLPWFLENLPRFDVAILHGLWLYNDFALHKALKFHKANALPPVKLPMVYAMPHGMLDPYFQKSNGRKLKALRNWVYWKLIEGNIVNGADGLLFTCEEEKRLAQIPFKPYRPKRKIVVGLGVEEPPTFTEAMRGAFLEQCPELQQQPFVLFLSRIHEKKGVDLLIKAYAEVACKMVTAKTESVFVAGIMGGEVDKTERISLQFPKLVIAGPGLDSPYGERMQQMVAESNELKNVVIFPGMLTGDAKWGAFYGCEAFILPSHQENFGIAVVEALACAKPVLISNQVNIWREIEAVGGGLVADDSQEGTIALLEQWQLLSKKQKLEMQHNARGAYEKFFAIRPNVTRLLDAISF
ncbi:glycosyltransferase [Pontibacter diazotrophicus]|uniref:Glycosyltransferase n=1 Tax=Pontibacter diazotrophicus TaxID=1400979 RepID=A0A3D8L0Z5_9BACT|nr:glycosyltransferase [Pontibacter diazotrophicus]RDV11094.1 glycosyltransferase [Pontibacter diazotrophicus]